MSSVTPDPDALAHIVDVSQALAGNFQYPLLSYDNWHAMSCIWRKRARPGVSLRVSRHDASIFVADVWEVLVPSAHDLAGLGVEVDTLGLLPAEDQP